MTKEEALDRMRARCSRAEYCSGQAVALLEKWRAKQPELSDNDIAEIISVLVSERFIDDVRFANAFVRDKLRFNGWGKQKIVYRLKSLGVDNDIITEALQKNYYAADNCGECNESGLCGRKVLEKLILKKWESLHKDEPLQKRKEKVMRFAISRGFDYSDVVEIVNAVYRSCLKFY